MRKRVLAIANLMHMRASGRRPGENSAGAQSRPEAEPERVATPEVRLRKILSPARVTAPSPVPEAEADHQPLMAEELSPPAAGAGGRQLANGGLATGAAVAALYSHEAARQPSAADELDG